MISNIFFERSFFRNEADRPYMTIIANARDKYHERGPTNLKKADIKRV